MRECGSEASTYSTLQDLGSPQIFWSRTSIKPPPAPGSLGSSALEHIRIFAWLRRGWRHEPDMVPSAIQLNLLFGYTCSATETPHEMVRPQPTDNTSDSNTCESHSQSVLALTSHRIASLRIASHRIASHRIASYSSKSEAKDQSYWRVEHEEPVSREPHT